MIWISTNVLDSTTRSTRRVTRRCSVAILSTLIPALCLLPSAARGEETLRVVIHESAKLPGPQMAGALVIATTLFKAVDVRLEWHKPSEASDRWPTVVVASSTSFEHGAFGPSNILGRVVQPSVRAYVLYDRVAELARMFRVDPTTVLGQVIAHEVGHLIFGGEHASTGLMASRIHPGSSFEDPFPFDERPELRAALQFDLAAMAESPVCDR